MEDKGRSGLKEQNKSPSHCPRRLEEHPLKDKRVRENRILQSSAALKSTPQPNLLRAQLSSAFVSISLKKKVYSLVDTEDALSHSKERTTFRGTISARNSPYIKVRRLSLSKPKQVRRSSEEI